MDSTSASPQMNFLVVSSPWAYEGFAKGAQLFEGLGVVKRFLGGSVACFTNNFFLNCAIYLVRFGAYFHKFFTLRKSKKKFLYRNNDKL